MIEATHANAAVAPQLGPAVADANANDVTVRTLQAQREAEADSQELRKRFNQFVGESFFGIMLKTMRQSVGKPAYFHGGRAEEIFQGQLDQMLSENLSQASASTLSDPMFELFQLRRGL
ncbi:MAG: hypothetical protein DWQ31_13155 [Planctomycetota bacterium]|nr:MAG: hypothetical protein DWQ31_13155 [Planctomycetota bacterium]REJ87083.1 MAG: hypothetical protein DWQ35_22035 [Planctomycetota bacterium]REK26999.1 MAG: hypothetical protein DWQ42_08040 [Planctomycetota bacterium]REK47274.1 MAG: hypothetical protein DWQ46_04570 [Planctomycetota bacterium]